MTTFTQCDCCGKTRECTTVVAFGIETCACEKCQRFTAVLKKKKMRKLIAATAIALLVMNSTTQAASSSDDLICYVTDKHNVFVYSFMEINHPMTKMFETSFTKNHKTTSFNVGHQPLWTVQDNKAGGILLSSDQARGWVLGLQPMMLTKDGNRHAEVVLVHNSKFVAEGYCARQGGFPNQGAPSASPPAGDQPQPLGSEPVRPTNHGVIQLYNASGGNFLDVVIGDNRWTARMLLDTGATFIALPESKDQTLVNHGDAHWSDQTATVRLADGRSTNTKVAVIHKVTLDGRSISNVLATSSAEGASMLLGNQALAAFGPYRIDQTNQTLTFEK